MEQPQIHDVANDEQHLFDRSSNSALWQQIQHRERRDQRQHGQRVQDSIDTHARRRTVTMRIAFSCIYHIRLKATAFPRGNHQELSVVVFCSRTGRCASPNQTKSGRYPATAKAKVASVYGVVERPNVGVGPSSKIVIFIQHCGSIFLRPLNLRFEE